MEEYLKTIMKEYLEELSEEEILELIDNIANPLMRIKLRGILLSLK